MIDEQPPAWNKSFTTNNKSTYPNTVSHFEITKKNCKLFDDDVNCLL